MIREQVGGAAWDSWPVGAQVAVVSLEDTLAAQTRLLELAGTMAEAVDAWNDVPNGADCRLELTRLAEALDAFTAAQAEYQATGKVPCPECERLRARLQEGDENLIRTEAERDDLRRQLEHQTKEADEYGRWLDQAHNERDKAQADADGLRRQLAEAQDSIRSLEEDCARIIRQRERLSERNFEMARERDQAQADNAALVEALSKYGEHTGGDEEEAKGDETACGCGLWNILSRPHPGAGLLAELAALRKVAEAARYATDIKDVYNALVDLDAIHNRKEQPNV